MELFMSLKKLTDSIHKKAEQTKWSQLLISGNMTNHQYGQYLYNQLQIYSALESRAAELQIFNNHKIINNIKRIIPMAKDSAFFKYESGLEKSTLEYIDYCTTMTEQQVLAHIYVRHFGDMHGGQIIKQHVPEPSEETVGSCTDKDGNVPWGKGNVGWCEMYNFNEKYETIKYMRSLLKNEMADEAIFCFKFAIDLFHDLEKRFDL